LNILYGEYLFKENLMDLKSKTGANLLKTFAGESRAHLKYKLYAEIAMREGYIWIAEIFKETAYNELAHAREVYERFLGLASDTKGNLMDAIKGETEERKNIYRQFEEDARNEGFDEIADFYKEIRDVEENHEERFTDIYERVESGNLFESSENRLWKCMNCGYIFEGTEAPMICPLCKYPQRYFKPYCYPLNEMKE